MARCSAIDLDFNARRREETRDDSRGRTADNRARFIITIVR